MAILGRIRVLSALWMITISSMMPMSGIGQEQDEPVAPVPKGRFVSVTLDEGTLGKLGNAEWTIEVKAVEEGLTWTSITGTTYQLTLFRFYSDRPDPVVTWTAEIPGWTSWQDPDGTFQHATLKKKMDPELTNQNVALNLLDPGAWSESESSRFYFITVRAKVNWSSGGPSSALGTRILYSIILPP